jgi:hypothetical protein
MKYLLSRILILVLLVSPLQIILSQTIDPATALPEEIDGWKSGAVRTFTGETLYDYIDGGAELFLSFGFSKVINRIYTREGQPDIIVDIFYMNTPYDAYGVFSHSVGKVDREFGQGSQTPEGAIIFWKNKFYISILAGPETTESKAAINKIALALDSVIPLGPENPPVVNYLPLRGIVEGSTRYFRHYIWLNSSGFISNENILNIDQNTQCVSAQYTYRQEKAVMLAAEYPDEEKAIAATEKFIENYNPALKNSPVLKTKENTWIGLQRTGKLFAVVFNSTSEFMCRGLLNEISTTYKMNAQ